MVVTRSFIKGTRPRHLLSVPLAIENADTAGARGQTHNFEHLGVLAQQSNAKRRFGSNFVND
jgi:hypothetical protein